MPEYDLMGYGLLGGYWTFEPWAVGSGMIETLSPPPLNGKVYLKDIEGVELIFSARVVSQGFDHKTKLYRSELKDAVSAIYKNGVEFTDEDSDAILTEIATGAGETYDDGVIVP